MAVEGQKTGVSKRGYQPLVSILKGVNNVQRNESVRGYLCMCGLLPPIDHFIN